MLAIALLLALSPEALAAEWPRVSADSAVVMAADGQILYGKNEDKRSLIASTTKLMTALVVLENASLAEPVTVRADCCNIEGSSMGLKPGEVYTVEELLLGLLLASGNDAAMALAEHVSGSQRAFVRLMKHKAKELGMTATSFANPHGLDSDNHYSTASDMARLMLACMENEDFVRLSGTVKTKIHSKDYVNHNRLLTLLPGCVAGKTGYTMAAGRCLVSCCIRDGMELVCVTLSDPNDWNDQIRLYERAYAGYCCRCVTDKLSFRIPVLSGAGVWAEIVPEKELELVVPRDSEIALKCEYPGFVFAPVKKGETAGRVWVIIDGKTVGEFGLVFAKDIQAAVPCIE